ncbi:hypothetical protein BDR05DRAFT_968847, partial [Suillus weaverae]
MHSGPMTLMISQTWTFVSSSFLHVPRSVTHYNICQVYLWSYAEFLQFMGGIILDPAYLHGCDVELGR